MFGLSITRSVAALGLVLAAFAVSACVHPLPEINPAKHTSPKQEKPFEQETTGVPPLAKQDKRDIGIPEELKGSMKSLNLSQIVDVALRNNPDTRRVWALAQAAAANWGIVRGAYYPTVQETFIAAGGKVPISQYGQSYVDSNLGLTYLLLDFGARGAKSEAARQALIQANWNHNQAIQDILRNVPQAYYTLLANKALVKANTASLAEAKTSLAAAEERRRSGVATIADVLQAKALVDQREYNLAGAKGSVEISRGNLATVAGWPASTHFDVADEIENIPVKNMGNNIDALIDQALKDRPDLNAAVANVRQQEALLKSAKALPFPKVVGNGNLVYHINKNGSDATAYYGGVNIQIPIFDGFAMKNNVRQADAMLRAAKAALKSQEDTVMSQVWTAHYNFATAVKQFDAARSMLASSSQSFNVSLGQYKEGVTNIVNLMTAEAQLADARSQLIGSRMGLYTSYAELVHAIGSELTMESPGENKRSVEMESPEKTISE